MSNHGSLVVANRGALEDVALVDPPLRFFEHLRETALKGYIFVLTSTHAARVEQLVGRSARVYEVVGKPLDLDAIVSAVREAARARPTE